MKFRMHPVELVWRRLLSALPEREKALTKRMQLAEWSFGRPECSKSING